MVAGAGALAYLLWKKALTEEQKCKLSGGDWVPKYCGVPPCPADCVK